MAFTLFTACPKLRSHHTSYVILRLTVPVPATFPFINIPVQWFPPLFARITPTSRPNSNVASFCNFPQPPLVFQTLVSPESWHPQHLTQKP